MSCERDVTSRRIVRGILLLGCLSLLVSSAFVASGGDPGSWGVIASANEDDNETVRHHNPEEYGEGGDDDGLQAWLERSLTSSLEDSAVELSQGEYDAAREVIGEEYRQRFGQLVEVDGDTGSYDTDDDDDDDEPTPDEDFEQAREEQERLADALEEFNRTLEEYEEAVDADEEERARNLARDLEELADEIQELGGSVEARFERLTERTGGDLSAGAQSINETTTEVERERTTIITQQFEETTLVVEPIDESISFLDPLEADGRLTDADGEPIADREITIEVAGESRTVHTDADGAFDLEYRPVDLSASTDELLVGYVPDRDAEYIGDRTTVNVSVDQETPTIADLETTEETAYGDPIHVGGELAVDDVPVDGVPLEVAFGGQRLGEITVSDGSFDGTVETPATPPEGDHELTVRLPFEDRALASTNETAPITVLETETVVTITETSVDEDAEKLWVNGTVATVDGDAVPDGSIQVDVDGTSETTATTDGDGRFYATVALSTSPTDEVDVTATYDGSGTNLASAGETVTVALETPSGSALSGTLVALGGAFVGLVLAGGGLVWFRRRRDPNAEVGDGTTTVHEDEQSEPVPTVDRLDPLLVRSAEFLGDGRPTMAVRTGYAAARRALRPETDDDSLTHWEFYQRYHGNDAEELRRVTETYERATYTPDPVSDEEAESALERIDRLCGDGGGRNQDVADD